MSQRMIWGATLQKAMALQCGAVAGLAGIVAVLVGGNAALSLLCGGAAVVLPNVVLAAWLMPRLRGADASGAVALMVAEALKLGATTALLLAAVFAMKAVLVWPAFIAGIIAALVANWVSLWVTRRY